MNEISKRRKWIHLLLLCLSVWFANDVYAVGDTLRTMKYTGRPEREAIVWQEEVRSELFSLLKLDDLLTNRENISLNPKEIRSVDKGAYLLKEIEINATSNRRIRVVATFPKRSMGPWPAVVCIHGHGGESRSVYEKASIYKGFADALPSVIM